MLPCVAGAPWIDPRRRHSRIPVQGLDCCRCRLQPRSSLFSAPAGCARRVCGDLGKHLSSPIQAVAGPRVLRRRVRLPHWPASHTVCGNPAENPRSRRRNPPCLHQRRKDGADDDVSSWPLKSARSGGRVLGLPLLSSEP